jgi:hypothetical protein
MQDVVWVSGMLAIDQTKTHEVLSLYSRVKADPYLCIVHSYVILYNLMTSFLPLFLATTIYASGKSDGL